MVDLGAGCGLLGIAISKISRAKVVCTDYSECVLDRLLHNISINTNHNDTDSYVKTRKLDWQYPVFLECDLVVSADTIYDPISIPWLCNTLRIILSGNLSRCKCLIAFEARRSATFEHFHEQLKRHGLRYDVLPLPEKLFFYTESCGLYSVTITKLDEF